MIFSFDFNVGLVVFLSFVFASAIFIVFVLPKVKLIIDKYAAFVFNKFKNLKTSTEDARTKLNYMESGALYDNEHRIQKIKIAEHETIHEIDSMYHNDLSDFESSMEDRCINIKQSMKNRCYDNAVNMFINLTMNKLKAQFMDDDDPIKVIEKIKLND